MSSLPQIAPFLPKAFLAHLEALEMLHDWEDRYGYIIDLGKSHPHLPESQKTPMHLVPGCTSQVWLVLKTQGEGADAELAMAADSDALIVRGLLALLTSAFNGVARNQLATQQVLKSLEDVGLLTNLSMNRRNGLASVLGRIKAFVSEYAENTV